MSKGNEGIPRTAEEAGKLTSRDAPKVEAGSADPDFRSMQRGQLHERVDRDFRSHRPTTAGAEGMRVIGEGFRQLSHLLVDVVPPGRELSTALTKLEEASFHTNAGIARHG